MAKWVNPNEVSVAPFCSWGHALTRSPTTNKQLDCDRASFHLNITPLTISSSKVIDHFVLIFMQVTMAREPFKPCIFLNFFFNQFLGFFIHHARIYRAYFSSLKLLSLLRWWSKSSYNPSRRFILQILNRCNLSTTQNISHFIAYVRISNLINYHRKPLDFYCEY